MMKSFTVTTWSSQLPAIRNKAGIAGERGFLEKIGLFGGTFNPIHRGHLRAAVEVRQKFQLDLVYFIPSSTPPHKAPDVLAGAADRLAMIRLAIADTPFFRISEVEISRGGPSFTIDTVRSCRLNFPENTDLYLILGMDAFLEIHTWKSYRDLLQSIPFIVMPRPTEEFNQSPRGWEMLCDYLSRQISDRYRFCEKKLRCDHPDCPCIYLADIGLTDVSSTHIRHCIRTGQPIDRLVPSDVNAYIKTKGLYV